MRSLIAEIGRDIAEMTLAANVATAPVPLGAALRRTFPQVSPGRATLNKRKKRKNKESS